MPDYRTPGVYIEEIPATGPIAGVGTSTPVFIGPALDGPINVPTKITNWTQFRSTFGNYITAPRHYLAYAVRGFFENGGTVAYIVRVGTAQRAFRLLADRGAGGGNALRVEAREEGTVGNSITVAVQNAQIVPPAQNARVRKARAATASVANNVITLQNAADAALFAPGDVLIIEGTAARAGLERIRGAELIVDTNLAAAGAGFVRIANLIAGQREFRVETPNGIEPGSVLQLSQGATQESRSVRSVAGEFVTLDTPLGNGYGLAQADATVAITSFEFNLVIDSPTTAPENFLNLSMDPRHSRYFARVVSSELVTVALPPVPSTETPPSNRPAVTGAVALGSGSNDDLSAIGLLHYNAALTALEKVDDVNLVCVPDRTDAGAQAAVVAHCEAMADRFAILDSAFNSPPFGTGSVLDQRAAAESTRGYAALYYPWIRINDPSSLTGEGTILVPPSGHLAGIFARTDNQRGVHKAPANEPIRGAVGLERIVDDAEHGELNTDGVDVLRIFPGQARPMVWGARTTAPRDQTAWRYVNVRRLMLYIEESIQEGIRWAVFEPNDFGLWKKLERTIREFLTRVWRAGALVGRTPEEAFYIKIDEENNPRPVQLLGQVIIEIGVAPVTPAEFVIVRIGMWSGGSEVTES